MKTTEIYTSKFNKAMTPYHGISYQAALQYADENNLKIVIPQENQLQLDYDDTLEIPKIFDTTMQIFKQLYDVKDITVTKAISKSGNGLHVTIEVKGASFDNMERIAWQAVFGSDPKREALSILRISSGNDRPTLFYERNK